MRWLLTFKRSIPNLVILPISIAQNVQPNICIDNFVMFRAIRLNQSALAGFNVFNADPDQRKSFG